VVEFRILGPLEVHVDQRSVAVRAGNDRLLLALLLLRRNRIVSLETLVDELWEAEPPTSAAKIVQNSVSRLRRTLGERLETHERAYRLRLDEDEIDAVRFERLVAAGRGAEALLLWRDDPFADVGQSTAVAAEAERLRELRLTALEQELETDVDAGAAATLERLTKEHPYRERFHALLMRALYAAGRQSEALDVYQRLRTRLAVDLGLDPSPELQELQRMILNQDAALAGPSGGRRDRRHRRTVIVGLMAAAATVAAVALAATWDRGRDIPPVAPNTLVRLDAHSGRVRDVIRVGRLPGAMIGCDGSVFVENALDNTVSAVDPETRQVKTVGGFGKSLGGLACQRGSVWIASRSTGNLVRFDAQTLAVQETLAVPGGTAWFPVIVEGTVWVTTGVQPDANVIGVDLASGRVVRSIPAAGTIEIAAGRHSLWVAEAYTSSLLRVDVRTGRAARVRVGAYPNEPVYAYGSAWIASLAGTVTRVDPATLEVEDVVHVRGALWSIAAGAGAIWVTNRTRGTLLEIDPHTAAIRRTIRLGFKPHWVRVVGGDVWVGIAAQKLEDAGT
jgi:DNA-binding SARP family transcriptional activator/DNA-binding beta-propeller fold protein YncE